MSLTDDPKHPGIGVPRPDGQNEAYLILSAEERAKGFVAPLRLSYRHVGERPVGSTRPLTPEEQERFKGLGYVLFEFQPLTPNSGFYWTQARLESGCGVVTKMADGIAETYARDPSFYGATFCVGCGRHFPVAEFAWCSDDTPVGSPPGSAPHANCGRGRPSAVLERLADGVPVGTVPSGPPRFTVLVRCEAGHEQRLTTEGMAREWVESWCKLLDGTHPMYLSPPAADPRSVLGKCQHPGCGRPFRAEIVTSMEYGDSTSPGGS